MVFHIRRLEELIGEARSLAYSENYSLTEGWNQNTLTDIFNLGQKKLYNALTEIDDCAYVQEVNMDVVPNQQAYDLPIDVHMALRLVDVRYLYGTTNYQFIELVNSPLQDRYPYPTNLPQIYTIRNGQILLSPVPTSSRLGALVINYQKRLRDLDIRRGLVDTIDNAAPPATITVDYSSPSQKNAGMREAGESTLDLVDYICFVDTDGLPIVSEIPIQSYNQTTQVITTGVGYQFSAADIATITALQTAGEPIYIVTGKYSTTNCELDTWCENALIEYAVLRLLRLQSAHSDVAAQFQTEDEVIKNLITQHRRIRPTVYRAEMMGSRRSMYYPYFTGRY
jgi:hypothetical protein